MSSLPLSQGLLNSSNSSSGSSSGSSTIPKDNSDNSDKRKNNQGCPTCRRWQSIERCIKSLEKASDCVKECPSPSCIKMKNVFSHTKNCKRKNNQGCRICRQLVALCCFHAKSCVSVKCLVPYCHLIRSNRNKRRQSQQKNKRS
jgi:E1A/CREB-binding protein